MTTFDMTDEERQKLCVWLRTLSHPAVLQAADEIERLAAHVNALEHIINLDMYEATKTALVQAQDEIERLEARCKQAEEALNKIWCADEYGILLERTTNMLDLTVRG
jgi:pyruvate-formate lyase-activating enzyme